MPKIKLTHIHTQKKKKKKISKFLNIKNNIKQKKTTALQNHFSFSR